MTTAKDPRALRRPGLLRDIGRYLKKYRRWWLLPMILILVVFGVLAVVAEVAPVVSPFIYTLF
jgi:hypothetical protein